MRTDSSFVAKFYLTAIIFLIAIAYFTSPYYSDFTPPRERPGIPPTHSLLPRSPQSKKINDTYKIAVIDTGLNLQDPRFKFHLCIEGHADFTGQGLKDIDGHGTHIAGLIVKNMSIENYCLIIIKHYYEKATRRQAMESYERSLTHAIQSGADFINFSGGGPSKSEVESSVILSNPNVIFIVAAGNESQNIDLYGNKYYPASYPHPNVISVGSVDYIGGPRSSFSNFGNSVDVWEVGNNVLSYAPLNPYGAAKEAYMSGTSMATAIHTAKYVSAYVKRMEANVKSKTRRLHP